MKTTIAGEITKHSTQTSIPSIVWVLIAMLVFLAVGALVGGGGLILGPDGRLIHMPFSHLQRSPFSSFLIPGTLLFIFNGIYPSIIAYSLWKRPGWRWPGVINPFKQYHWSWAGALVAGIIVLVWIIMEMLWVPVGLVHVFYLIYGVVLIGITLSSTVRRHSSRFLGMNSRV